MFNVISFTVTSLLIWDLIALLHLPRFDLLDLGAFLDVTHTTRSLRRWLGGSHAEGARRWLLLVDLAEDVEGLVLLPLLDALDLLALELEQVHHFSLLCRLARELLEERGPLVSQVDPVGLLFVLPHGKALLRGMLN